MTPSTPDPNRVAQWCGTIRILLAFLMGVGFAVPTLSDSQLATYVQATMIVFPLLAQGALIAWSRVYYIWAARAAHDNAVASAAAGVPVKVASA